MGMLDKSFDLNRRSFLKSSGACAGALALAGSSIPSVAMATVPVPKYLFVIFCEGGWDNVLVNYRDQNYYNLRGPYAMKRPGTAPDALLDIDGTFGMHPGMARMRQMILNREMSAFHGVALADSRTMMGNHFTSTKEIYFGGSTTGGIGFLNRLTSELDGARTSPGAISMTEATGYVPDIITGPALTAGIRPVIPVLSDQQIVDKIKTLYGSPTHAYAQLLQQGIDYERNLRNSLLGHEQLVNDPILSNACFYLPQIAEITALLMQGGPTAPNIVFTRVGGFDLHDRPYSSGGEFGGAWSYNYSGANMLHYISEGVGAFRDAMVQANKWQDTMVIVMSEFGRAFAVNSTGGTDHGDAQPIFMASGNTSLNPTTNVSGYWPSLSSTGFNGGLRASVDGFDIIRTYMQAFYGSQYLSLAAAARVLPRRTLDLATIGKRTTTVITAQNPATLFRD